MAKKKPTETVISDKIRGNTRIVKTMKDGDVITTTEPVKAPKPAKRSTSKKGKGKKK